MIVNAIRSNQNNQQTFNALYAKTEQGWQRLTSTGQKYICSNKAMNGAFERAKTKRSLLVSIDEVLTSVNLPALGKAKKKGEVSQMPVLLTNETAREFDSLCKDEKASFFGKFFKRQFEIVSNVETEKLKKPALCRLF